jgi:hypothetical protein
MRSHSRFEKMLCDRLTDRLGVHITPRNILAWDMSKPWLESINAEGEELIFLPGPEVWCLVRQNVKQSGSPTFNNEIVSISCEVIAELEKKYA